MSDFDSQLYELKKLKLEMIECVNILEKQELSTHFDKVQYEQDLQQEFEDLQHEFQVKNSGYRTEFEGIVQDLTQDLNQQIKAVDLEHKILLRQNKKLEKQIEDLDAKNGFLLAEFKIIKSKDQEAKQRNQRLVKSNRTKLQNFKIKMDKMLIWEKNRVLGID